MKSKSTKVTYKMMKEAEFDNIKLMQRAGLSPTVTVTATKRSSPTIRKVFKANTFEEYKDMITIKKPAKVEEPSAKEFADSTFELIDMLNRIYTKVDGIETTVSALANQTEKQKSWLSR